MGQARRFVVEKSSHEWPCVNRTVGLEQDCTRFIAHKWKGLEIILHHKLGGVSDYRVWF